MRRSLMPALTLVLGIAAGAIGATVLRAAEPPWRETPLLRVDLEGLVGQELMVSRFDTAAGWAHGRHHHPGHELVYVLEGSAVLEVAGRPPRLLGPGDAALVPPGEVHAGRNASADAPFRFLLVRIHPKGQPLSVELD